MWTQNNSYKTYLYLYGPRYSSWEPLTCRVCVPLQKVKPTINLEEEEEEE